MLRRSRGRSATATTWSACHRCVRQPLSLTLNKGGGKGGGAGAKAVALPGSKLAAEHVSVRASGRSSEEGEAHCGEEEEVMAGEAEDKKSRLQSAATRTTPDVTQEETGEDEEEEDGPVIQLALALLRFYRTQISPLTPPSCRFIPTCSQYSMQARGLHRCTRGSPLGFFSNRNSTRGRNKPMTLSMNLRNHEDVDDVREPDGNDDEQHDDRKRPFARAFRKFGASKGFVLTAWRIVRCNPWGGTGYDPPVWQGKRGDRGGWALTKVHSFTALSLHSAVVCVLPPSRRVPTMSRPRLRQYPDA